MSEELSAKPVATWGMDEVKSWTQYYGFKEEKVKSNIEVFNIDGLALLKSDITAEDFGINMKSSIAVAMFGIRMKELKERHAEERLANLILSSNKRKIDAIQSVNSMSAKKEKSDSPKEHNKHENDEDGEAEDDDEEEEEESELHTSECWSEDDSSVELLKVISPEK
jgi:hypothetical protein